MPTTTDKIAYANSAAITCTLNSLSASTTAGRQCTPIDNSSNLYDDALLTIIISTSASALGNTKACYLYLFGSEDGTNYIQDSAVMGAADAAYTIDNPTNLRGGIPINCGTSSKVYNFVTNVAQFFGGVMPKKWGFVLTNDTNQALASSGNSASYTGITYTNS